MGERPRGPGVARIGNPRRLARAPVAPGPLRPPLHPFPAVGSGPCAVLHEVRSPVRLLSSPSLPARGPGPDAVAEGVRGEEAGGGPVLRLRARRLGRLGETVASGKVDALQLL